MDGMKTKRQPVATPGRLNGRITFRKV